MGHKNMAATSDDQERVAATEELAYVAHVIRRAQHEVRVVADLRSRHPDMIDPAIYTKIVIDSKRNLGL